MKRARLLILLVLAFLAVFAQAVLVTPRVWLGSPINLVPPLVVYAALRLNLAGLTCLSVVAGLWLDALSANPLGVSVLPLFLIGLGLWQQRDLLLRELDYAQLLLGAAASAVVPVLTLGLVLSKGLDPDVGWHSLWQLVVLTVTGGVFTPLVFRLMDRIETLFLHPPIAFPPYRRDHDLKRGRY